MDEPLVEPEAEADADAVPVALTPAEAVAVWIPVAVPDAVPLAVLVELPLLDLPDALEEAEDDELLEEDKVDLPSLLQPPVALMDW